MDDETENNDDKTDAKRRRLLKLAGIAGATAVTISLPEKWTRPVVEFIVVPAHADASANSSTTTTTLSPTTSEAPTTTTSTTEEPTTTEESTTTTEPP